MGTSTIAALRVKASEVDDLMYEAQKAELMWATELLMSVIPRSWVESGAASAGYVDVRSQVEEFAKVDPEVYGDAADLVALAISPHSGSPLTGLDSEISNIKDVVDPGMWDGEAARAYRSEHLNVYPDVANQQMNALEELHGAIQSYADLLTSVYDSLDQVLENSKSALQSIIDTGGGGKAVSVVLSAISAAVTVTGAVATGGSSLAIRFAVATGGIGISQTLLSSGGNKTTDIGRNIHESITTLRSRVDEFDEELATGLQEDIRLIEDRLNIGLGGATKPMEIPRPGFADDPSAL